MEKRYMIRCKWDTEAGVWYVTESDVPGLSLEARTQQEMSAKLQHAVPELLELNGLFDDGPEEVPLSPLYQREVVARRRSA